jgi:hypothetical protein
VTVIDWSGLHPYIPDGVHTPSRLQDLVAVVQLIEAKASRAKAVGSLWSLSQAPDSDNFVIKTNGLNRHLSQPFPLPPTAFTGAFRSPAHNAPWLRTWDHADARAPEGFLVHVEAGIQIKQLLVDLASAGLALPTMGAGAGQTLAGALSTGTHGSDVAMPVLGDFVRAVHLVGPGGQEWWIEGNGGSGRSVNYTQWPEWCEDTRVVRDTDFLKSVVVGVGRFGVIYSMVIEVVAQYRLEEHREETTWDNVKSSLTAAVASGYTTAGNLFNAPLGGSPLQFWQANIDVAGLSRTWLTRRWRTINLSDEEIDEGTGLMGYLCTHDFETVTLVVSLTSAVATTLHNTGLAIAQIPIVGPYLAADYFALAGELILAAANFTTLGNFAAKVIDLLRDFDGIGSGLMKGLIEDINGSILAGEHDPPLRRGPSHKILDTHNYALDGCFSVDSAEFFFDAAKSSYIQFVDDLCQVASDLGPLAGVIALRFIQRTSTMLGMQRFPLTVAIEVAVSRPGSSNAEYMDHAHSLALTHGGIPHWGQEHKLNVNDVEKTYGNDLELWRWALAETERDMRGTFSSEFTQTRGLETPETLATYRARRYFAAIASGVSL